MIPHVLVGTRSGKPVFLFLLQARGRRRAHWVHSLSQLPRSRSSLGSLPSMVTRTDFSRISTHFTFRCASPSFKRADSPTPKVWLLIMARRLLLGPEMPFSTKSLNRGGGTVGAPLNSGAGGPAFFVSSARGGGEATALCPEIRFNAEIKASGPPG